MLHIGYTFRRRGLVANPSDLQPTLNGGGAASYTSKGRAMSNSDDFARLDDTTLLLMRQSAADSGNAERQRALEAEVVRRTAMIRGATRGRMVTTVLTWRPDAVNSADLTAGIKAAKELNAVPLPAWLSKQLSNYILRAERELEARATGSRS